MWTLAKIEMIRNYCEKQKEIDSCDTLMLCVYNYIYNTNFRYTSKIGEILVNNISTLNYYLENDGVLFIEITNNRTCGLYRVCTFVHFFVLFKSQKYPICLQSYCNRYEGRISEWPTWQEDLTLLLSSDYKDERVSV